MMGAIGEAIEALANGEIDAAEAGKRIKKARVPKDDPGATTGDELAARDWNQEDTGLTVQPGTFDEVSAAFHTGKISQEQYDGIVDAMAGKKSAPAKSE